MVKTVGIDPTPETQRAKLLQFVLRSWKDAIFKIFNFKGRTPRAGFLVFIIPIIMVWLGITSWFTTSDMNPLSDLYKILAYLRLGFGGLTIISLPAIIMRRLHDGANKSVKGLGLFSLFGVPGLLFRLFVDFDRGDNKFGSPQKSPPKQRK